MDRLNKSTSANCADKRKKQRSRLRLRWIFLLLMAHTLAWAQDYPEYPANVSSLPIWEKQSSGDFKIEGVIDISSPIYVNGELKLYPVATSNNPTPTIRRIFDGSNLQYAVFVLDGTDKLSIVGNENNQLTFFGGTGNINNPIPTNERNMGGAVQCEGNAEVRLKYVNLARFAVKAEGGSGDAVIALNGASSNGKCYLDHTTFSNCYAGQWDLTATDNTSWGRIFSLRAGTWKVIMDDVDIHDCIVHERRNSDHSGIYGMGGIIRSQGNVGGSLLMRNCTIKDNQYRDLYKDGATTVSYYYTRYSEVAQQPLSGQGGAINWRSGAFASNQETQVTISGCIFHDNFAMLGGAIATCATIEMNNTKIYGNKAEEGGGVYFWTYNANQDAYDGRGFTAEFNRNTLIYENTATVCGGGIAIRIDASDDVGFSADGTSRDVEFKVNLMAAEGHSQISDNHAPKGAGVAIIDRAPKNHKNTREELMDNSSSNPAYNRWSGEYTRTISIEGSEIFDNTTSSDHFSLGQNDKVAGGGIYIDKTSEDAPFPADYTVSNDGAGNSGGGGGSLTVNVKHGKIYGNNAINGTREGLGGGLYIANPMKNDFPSSELTVNIGNDTPQLHINKNQAYTHGGGFYILGGNVNITRGSNQTLQIGLNPNDNDNVYRGGNKALNGNGGGICVMGGTVEVAGGHVDYNTANQKGGGIYLNDGNLTFTGGNVDQNEASNSDGGGICVDGGNIVVSGGSVSNNEAKLKNGGGISVLGGLISIASGSIEHNTAAQDGGGVYVSVPDESSPTYIYDNTYINQNVAGRNGGGVCVDNGELYIHSADYENAPDDPYFGDEFDVPYGLVEAENETAHTRITNNKALAGKGGGVYLGEGYLCLGLALLYNNEAKLDGGGGYVGTGYILSADAKILQNTAEQSGGGINCFSGDFDIYGGDISYNKAINGNGGGCCVETGDIYLWPDYYYFATGTVVSHNKAGGNGGGLCNNAGLFELILAEVHHNEAGHNTLGGNGGGIFCNTDYNNFFDIRLYESSIDDNNAYGNSNDADNPTGWGGGIYIQEGTIYSEHSFLRGNTAQMNGGGISCFSGDLRFYATTIGEDGSPNTATNGKGGGIHTHQGNVVIGPCTTYHSMFGDMSSFIEHNTAKFDGGGICNQRGNITIHGGRINQNTAQTGKGGGVFINDGNITIKGGQINNNQANDPAGGYGGGVYSGGGVFHIMERQPNPIVELISVVESDHNPGKYEFLYKLTHQGRAINGSIALKHGISYTTDSISWDEIEFGSEGVPSFYVPDEDAATIVYRLEPDETYYVKAWAYYEDGGNLYYGESSVEEVYIIYSNAKSKAKGKASNRPRSIYPSVEENPFFMELTPLQQAIMANTPEGDSTTRSSRKGRPTGNEPVDIPEINNNTATYGGGVYVDEEDAELIFSGGEIRANYASEDGGGIYITQEASMQMKRHCQVVDNHVPAGKKGGGIYLDGTLLVGDKKEDDATYHSLKVELNWAGNGDYTEAERNNVFLPLAPILDGDALHKKRVITLLSDISGKTNGIFNTKIGISVDRGFREVIYSENDEHEGGAVSTKQWLEKLMPESGNVLNSSLFDDAQTYYALHVTPTDNLFDEDYIYFWSCWTTIVNSDPNNDGTTHYTKSGTGANEVWHIYTREGLAWFSSRINGLNAFHENANPAAKAFVENDLDMSAHLWVPLGSVSNAEGTGTDIIFTPGGQYSGEFDGQGNIISGLICTYMTGIFKYGLFGTLAEGAKVKNTFVDNYMFTTYKQKDPDNPGDYINDPAYKMGGIAAEMANGTAVISNCEARGQMKAVICDAENTYVGGIAGDVQQGAIHSCMAMPTITGTAKYMGGLAGNLATATTLKNSFANVLFSTTPTPTYPVGGIAGENNGTIENVYVRYNNADNTPNLANNKFYWIAGLNNGSISYCFSPKDNTGSGKWVYTGPGSTAATMRRTYQPTHLVSGKYGFAHQDQVAETYDGDATTYIANGPIDNDGNLKGLLASLNNWVKDANKTSTIYTPWTRTMASTINDDYPVLEIADFNVVGTEDGVYMKYDYDVNDMWAENGKNFKALTAADNPKAAMYLYKTNPTAINVSGNEAVRLYIHENVGITQTDGAELHARVGVTFDNSDGTIANGGAPYDWHMFSSALKAAPLGITYRSDHTDPETGGKSYSLKYDYDHESLQTLGITDDNYHYRSRDYMDPPVIEWNTAPGTVGYFPTNTPYGQWGNSGHWPSSGDFSNHSFDFYCFHEESRHWINFKREGTTEFMDHWHEDIDGSGKHQNLRYENESTLRVGKGYMMGVSAVSMLMADGILNNGDVTSQEPLTNSEYSFNMSGYSEELRGTNLVGNPFQSYLNFSALANDDDNKNIIENGTYYLFDADARRYICYPATASDNQINAPQFIHPHQGFFVKTANGGNLKFKNSMRSATAGEGSTFRGDNLNYPLVNLFCYDAEGHYDVTTVEMNRPKLGGGSKLKDMRNGNSLIYARMENEDYQTLFAPTGTSTVPVRFEPSQDGVYTMRWGTLHGDFHYLHLVDNMSGADVDMLRSEEYRFEATTTDYLSRFKLVFEVTGLEEEDDNEDDNGSSIVNFAFRMGDELIVNGAGYLEVFDVQGRRLSAKRLVDAQSSVSLPNVAAGIYFLRLSDDKQVRTQKMVINY